MFLGHYAVGFALKKAAPRTSLGPLMTAPLLLDLIWPVFVLLGWETVRIVPGDTAYTPLSFVAYPWSHSLLMTAAWAAAFAGVYCAVARRAAPAAWIAAGVLSHWVLDAVSHRPDLPLTPHGSARVGLGLWNFVTATVLVELALFAAGVWLYLSATKTRDGRGRWGLWSLVAVLLLIDVANVQGNAPPSVTAIAATSLLAVIFPLWAWRIDRHRVPVGRAPASVSGPESGAAVHSSAE